MRGALTGQHYVDDILGPHVGPFLNGLPGAIFQQDNARPHTARVSQDFLRHFQTLPWPACCPNLSPVEHVWDQLKRQIPSCHSVHDLELAVQDLLGLTISFQGHDTTSVGISWCLWLVGLHPWIQDRIHAELDDIFGDDERNITMEDLKNMKYLECVIKESMRLYPSVPAFGRMIRNDIKIENYIVPKGSICLVHTFLLHRDPEFFPNPDKFDPDRFTQDNSVGRNPFAYVPFSAGPRNCIVQALLLLPKAALINLKGCNSRSILFFSKAWNNISNK
ncbi:cytochrome P450 4V2 [Trichonephila clavipes]|nr:cytochrome P450 4V2 [Trichonephila clavipes]